MPQVCGGTTIMKGACGSGRLASIARAEQPPQGRASRACRQRRGPLKPLKPMPATLTCLVLAPVAGLEPATESELLEDAPGFEPGPHRIEGPSSS